MECHWSLAMSFAACQGLVARPIRARMAAKHGANPAEASPNHIPFPFPFPLPVLDVRCASASPPGFHAFACCGPPCMRWAQWRAGREGAVDRPVSRLAGQMPAHLGAFGPLGDWRGLAARPRRRKETGCRRL